MSGPGRTVRYTTTVRNVGAWADIKGATPKHAYTAGDTVPRTATDGARTAMKPKAYVNAPVAKAYCRSSYVSSAGKAGARTAYGLFVRSP